MIRYNPKLNNDNPIHFCVYMKDEPKGEWIKYQDHKTVVDGHLDMIKILQGKVALYEKFPEPKNE